MALDKELAKTMAERSDWHGNPDRLWANVAQAIGRPTPALAPAPPQAPTTAEARPPAPAPARRPGRRIPAWAAAAAVAMLAAGTWALQPGTAPQVTPPPVTQPGTPTPKGVMPGPNSLDHRHPLVSFTNVDISPAQATFAPGEPVRLTVRFWNQSKEASLQLAGAAPQLRINPASVGFNPQQPAMATISLPALAGRTLAPGESVSVEAIWDGSALAPGWYGVELRSVHYEQAGQSGAIGIAGKPLVFVAYPPGAVKTGTVASGGTATIHDIALTVRKVEFSGRHTKVYFHLSQLRAPAEFGLTLERSGAPAGAPMGLSYNDSPEGGIDGVAEFDPTLAAAKSITVVVPDLFGVRDGQGSAKLAGPWRVTVLLK